MKNKICLVLRSLEKSQKTILIKKQIEKISNITIFTLDRSHNDIYMGKCVMPITNIYSNWNNIILATNFDEAMFASFTPTNSKRIFYIWDLDWNYSGLDYKIAKQCIEKFDKICCRSESHKKLIDAHFEINSTVVKNFNLEEIIYGTDNG